MGLNFIRVGLGRIVLAIWRTAIFVLSVSIYFLLACRVATRLQIVAGEHDRSANSNVRQTIDVAAYFEHPDYQGAIYNNDISLIKLATPVSFNENVTAICQPQTNDVTFYYGKESQISGWGTLRSGVCQSIIMNFFKQTELPLTS